MGKLIEYIIKQIIQVFKKINSKTDYIRIIKKENSLGKNYYQIQKGLFYGWFWVDALEVTKTYISPICFLTNIGASEYVKTHNTKIVKLNEKYRTLSS